MEWWEKGRFEVGKLSEAACSVPLGKYPTQGHGILVYRFFSDQGFRPRLSDKVPGYKKAVDGLKQDLLKKFRYLDMDNFDAK